MSENPAATPALARTPKLTPLAQIKELEKDPKLIQLCERLLPKNYDFEIPKTIWRIQKVKDCKTVALQMPEGLLLFATRIADVLRIFTGVDTILMGDITYGACCVDDFTAKILGADLLVHYGHSCLVPTSVASNIETIYIFVTMSFDVGDAVGAVGELVEKEKEAASGCSGTESKRQITISYDDAEVSGDSSKPFKVSLVSTIQFALSLPRIKEELETRINVPAPADSDAAAPRKIVDITIPRSKPLSNGEILGCTAPKVPGSNMIVYVGDGRFHLEAIMMANPHVPAYRYDPYNKTTTKEIFDHSALAVERQKAVDVLMQQQQQRLVVGIIFGTLGRQGNPKPIQHVYDELSASGFKCFVILMSEISPAKLNLFTGVDVWVQFACPRLSIDWGSAFNVPILTPYEAIWASKNRGSKYEGHPMDYYAYDSLGPHTPNYKPVEPGKTRHREPAPAIKKCCASASVGAGDCDN